MTFKPDLATVNNAATERATECQQHVTATTSTDCTVTSPIRGSPE
jgi:hypothetical protein